MLAIVENDRTLWANWGTAPAGEGTAVGAGGTRWVRLNPIRPRSIFHQSQTALAEPSAPAQEIVLATVQARAGAYGAVDISFTMSDWGRTQDPDAQIRIFYNGESSSENILVVDVSDTVADGPLVLGATMSDYPSALVTVTVYATGVIALAGARRVLTVRTD